jgi:hypothetical protein
VQTSLRKIREDLDTAGLIQRIPAKSAAGWDAVVNEWAESDLPLIVRRGGHSEMCMRIIHRDGRLLAPADNSPAHWIVMQCFSNVAASLSHVHSEIENIPMTMRMSKEEADACDFKKRLDDLEHPGRAGWYLAHIESVGLGRIGALEEAPIDRLKDHFRKLMRPSNMLLIAKTVSGLAEIDTFIS